MVLAFAAVAGALLGGSHAALSAALGVGLCAVNLFVMRRITRALTEGGSAVWALAFPLALGFAVLPLTSVFLPQPSTVRRRA